MSYRKLALAGAATVLAAAGLATITAKPAFASSEECSANACEYVTNQYQGSNTILTVQVWGNTSATHPLRWLLNGTPQNEDIVQANKGVIFDVDALLLKGGCIQGGVEGVTDGRTPCWTVP
jgi:hypothetical protein